MHLWPAGCRCPGAQVHFRMRRTYRFGALASALRCTMMGLSRLCGAEQRPAPVWARRALSRARACALAAHAHQALTCCARCLADRLACSHSNARPYQSVNNRLPHIDMRPIQPYTYSILTSFVQYLPLNLAKRPAIGGAPGPRRTAALTPAHGNPAAAGAPARALAGAGLSRAPFGALPFRLCAREQQAASGGLATAGQPFRVWVALLARSRPPFASPFQSPAAAHHPSAAAAGVRAPRHLAASGGRGGRGTSRFGSPLPLLQLRGRRPLHAAHCS